MFICTITKTNGETQEHKTKRNGRIGIAIVMAFVKALYVTGIKEFKEITIRREP